jgi:membrane associated rhomboid family serine protease
MGIHDRDYARNDGRSVFDGFVARTQVCIWLVAINVFVFLVQLATRTPQGGAGWFTDALVLDSDKILSGEFWRLLTHAFLHDYGPGGVFHIGFNMVCLWWAGSSVEDIYGAKEFLCFYLLAAVLAGLGYAGVQYLEGRHARALGASGAISAVMVVYATHYPLRVVYVFGLVPLPVWAIVIFQVLNDSLGLIGGSREPIAFAAHLSGALFGFLYALFSWRVSNWLPRFGSRSRKAPARPNVKPVKIFTEIVPDEEEETSRPVAPLPVAPAVTAARAAPAGGDRSKVDEHLEAKLDEVLEKVTKFGQSSLTESEREILLKASEIYRKKKGQ